MQCHYQQRALLLCSLYSTGFLELVCLFNLLKLITNHLLAFSYIKTLYVMLYHHYSFGCQKTELQINFGILVGIRDLSVKDEPSTILICKINKSTHGDLL